MRCGAGNYETKRNIINEQNNHIEDDKYEQRRLCRYQSIFTRL